jgi:hypothetical protein
MRRPLWLASKRFISPVVENVLGKVLQRALTALQALQARPMSALRFARCVLGFGIVSRLFGARARTARSASYARFCCGVSLRKRAMISA